MPIPTVVVDSYSVKLYVTAADLPEGDEGYVNFAWGNDIDAWSAFGVAGSQLGEPGTEYAAFFPGLANKAYVYADENTSGIALYSAGLKPVDAFINKARVGGWDSADNRMDTPAGFKCGTNIGHDGDVVVGGVTLHFKGGLLVGVN